MEKNTLENLCQWESAKSRLFMEITELNSQLANAMDRGDKPTMSMVVTMRQDPVSKAEEIAAEERAYVLTLPEEEAARAVELLNGAQADAPEEERLARVVSLNRENLSRLTAEDRRLSLQLGGRRSFYETFR